MLDQASHPASHRLGSIRRRGVETDFRVASVLVNEIEQLFEKQQLLRRSKSGADDNAIEFLCRETSRRHHFSGLSEIYKTILDVVPASAQTFQLRLDERANQ